VAVAVFYWGQYTGSGISSNKVNPPGTHASTGINGLAFKRTDAVGLVSSGGDHVLVPGTDASKMRSYGILLRPFFHSFNASFAMTVQNMKFWLFNNRSDLDGAVDVSYKRNQQNWGYDFGNATEYCFTDLYNASPRSYNVTNETFGSSLSQHDQRTLAPEVGVVSFSNGNTATVSTGGDYYAFGDWVHLQVRIGADHSEGYGGQSLHIMQYDETF